MLNFMNVKLLSTFSVVLKMLAKYSLRKLEFGAFQQLFFSHFHTAEYYCFTAIIGNRLTYQCEFTVEGTCRLPVLPAVMCVSGC